MLKATDFIAALETNGFSLFSGVPCSFLKEPMQILADKGNYIPASIEGEAAAIAAGAWLAGKNSVVFCQNSGLGNLINPLSSLNHPFEIPTLFVLGWRAAPGVDDEPQHQLMGATTLSLLEQMQVQSLELSTDAATMSAQVRRAASLIQGERKSVALLVRPKTFEPVKEPELKRPDTQMPGSETNFRTEGVSPSRYDALQTLTQFMPKHAAVVATTGKCGRELFTIADKDQHLYMVGAMGSASGVGLGIAVTQPGRPVVVLDGDGAALMRLGTLATIGQQRPSGLAHIILDNGTHDSTGGQPTGSEQIDFVGIALACGYRRAFRANTPTGLTKALEDALASIGPTLIHMKIQPGSIKDLGRPTITPADVATRFRAFMNHA